ncbi:MAG: cytochrome c, partial [Bacteroidetes bacterium]|nr:cytochrome c [Bacteroidota bacterium]
KTELISQILEKNTPDPVFRDAILSSLGNQELAFLKSILNHPLWQESTIDKAILTEMLSAAILKKGDPAEVATVFALIENEAQNWIQDALVSGFSLPGKEKSLISLKTEPNLFRKIGQYPTEMQNRLTKLSQQFDWPGKPEAENVAEKDTSEADIDPQFMALGRQQYLNTCSGCHGTDGKGMNRFAPPLVNSEWVLGDEKRLIYILLHGLEGPVEVNGKLYDAPEILPEMPSFSVLDNGDLAAILTYIRREWGHQADPVTGGRVGHLRYRSQGKITPWKAEDLLKESSDQTIE